MSCGERVAPAIVAASRLVTERLLQENKVFSCGNGVCGPLAAIFTQCLSLRHRIERPGLPALNLSAEASTLSAIAEQHSSEIFSRQLRTLGVPGDVLVILSTGSNASSLVQAIQTAHDRDMFVVSFTTDGDQDLAALLTNNDITISANNAEPHRATEIHLLGLFSVCELIDQQLFGGAG